MKAFRFLDHTADAKFEATGTSKQELFVHCAQALFTLMSDESAQPQRRVQVSVQAQNDEDLLFEFLSELLYVIEDKKLFLDHVETLTIDNNHLEAVLVGDDLNNHELRTYIKAITYHDLSVIHKNDVWRAVVVVDL